MEVHQADFLVVPHLGMLVGVRACVLSRRISTMDRSLGSFCDKKVIYSNWRTDTPLPPRPTLSLSRPLPVLPAPGNA